MNYIFRDNLTYMGNADAREPQELNLREWVLDGQGHQGLNEFSPFSYVERALIPLYLDWEVKWLNKLFRGLLDNGNEIKLKKSDKIYTKK